MSTTTNIDSLKINVLTKEQYDGATKDINQIYLVTDDEIDLATTSTNGLMSASDKTKLNGIATGANKTTVDSALSSTSTNPVQNKVVNTAINNCITGLSVSGATITYTKGDGSTGTITTQGDSTDTKVTNTLNKTAKAYVTGTTSSSTNTGTQIFDTGVYLDTTAGQLTATTFKGALSGNASTATKLATARTVRTNLASTSTASFDGSGNITPGVTGVLPVANGGTGNSSVDTTPTSGSSKMITSGGVYTAMAEQGISTYTHSKSGTVHSLTGSGSNGKAKITAGFSSGDTFKVNGKAVNAYCGANTVDGDTIVKGRWVTFTFDGSQLNFKGGGGLGNTKLAATTAEAANVLSGKTFYSKDKTLKTGTMTNNGAKTASLNCGASYTIPAGYHNGSGKVTANSLSSQTSANASASHILKGKTAWVNGSKITGTMPNFGWEPEGRSCSLYNGHIYIYVPDESTDKGYIEHGIHISKDSVVSALGTGYNPAGTALQVEIAAGSSYTYYASYGRWKAAVRGYGDTNYTSVTINGNATAWVQGNGAGCVVDLGLLEEGTKITVYNGMGTTFNGLFCAFKYASS